MRRSRRHSTITTLVLEPCEARSLLTLIFIFNGNGYGDAKPNALTAKAAQELEAVGNRAIQLANPSINSPAAVFGLKQEIEAFSRGEPIALVGFSAGGTLAERLAADPALHVTDVLACYSPPDLRDYLAYHGDDHDGQYVLRNLGADRAVIDLLSGPNDTQAHVVATFGLADHNVVAGPSTASFKRDYPTGQVYDYPGGHGVGINAGGTAPLDDFLAHL
jgi:hypothetical protein